MCVCTLGRFSHVDSVRPYGLYPSRLLCPWDSLGKNIGKAIPFSRGSSQPGIEPGSPASQADSLLSEPPGIQVILALKNQQNLERKEVFGYFSTCIVTSPGKCHIFFKISV